MHLRTGKHCTDPPKKIRQIRRDTMSSSDGVSNTSSTGGAADATRDSSSAQAADTAVNMRDVLHMMADLMQKSEERTTRLVEKMLQSQPVVDRSAVKLPKLSKLTETDDIEAWFLTAERVLAGHGVERENFVLAVAPVLSGKAQSAYEAMPTSESADYDLLKAAVLKRYGVTPESYRQKFRNAKVKQGESFQELATRLSDLFRKWTKYDLDLSTGDLAELLVCEQFLQCLPVDVQLFVRQQNPSSLQSAAEMADGFIYAKRASSSDVAGGRSSVMATVKDVNSQPVKLSDGKTSVTTSGGRAIRCYKCNGLGHRAAECPTGRAKLVGCADSSGKVNKSSVTVCGSVNGIAVQDIVMDTGCSQTLVHESLVDTHTLNLDDVIAVRCAHGDVVDYPTAPVCISVVPGETIKVRAGVSCTLPHEVLLGRDAGVQSLVNRSDLVHYQDALVTTRRQASQMPDRSVPTVHTDTYDDSSDISNLSDIDDSLFGTPGRNRKPKRLRRLDKQRGGPQAASGIDNENDELPVPNVESALQISKDELAKLQRDDPSLSNIWDKVSTGDCASTDNCMYSVKDGLLYRHWQSKAEDHLAVKQIVLPLKCRSSVLELAHDIPMAGHLGRKKTGERVMRRFYWPGMLKDIAEYCQSCEPCQRNSRPPLKAPLCPLPVIDTPFERVSVDFLGPLKRTKRGNRFVLLFVDHATRYAEAVAMRTMTAKRVAEELLKIFARLGIPQQVLSDQGSNFMSKMLEQLYKMLGIERLHTTPYHPQANGLTERMVGVVKQMLVKCAEDSCWDDLLPHVMFAYREVPQSSTGFSPFELLYGREVRGPLDVVKNAWEKPDAAPCHVLYMLAYFSISCLATPAHALFCCTVAVPLVHL